MANPEAITALPAGTVKATDYYPATDTTDFTEAPSGTTKKYSIAQLQSFLGLFSPVNFSAYITSAFIMNATGDGTLYTVLCNNIIIDNGEAYNGSTGIFTAPLTGMYSFTTALSLANLTTSFNNYYAYFHQTGSITNDYSIIYGNLESLIGTGNVIHWNGASDIYLVAGDQVSLVVQVSGSTKTVFIGGGLTATNFSGCYIG